MSKVHGQEEGAGQCELGNSKIDRSVRCVCVYYGKRKKNAKIECVDKLKVLVKVSWENIKL